MAGATGIAAPACAAKSTRLSQSNRAHGFSSASLDAHSLSSRGEPRHSDCPSDPYVRVLTTIRGSFADTSVRGVRRHYMSEQSLGGNNATQGKQQTRADRYWPRQTLYAEKRKRPVRRASRRRPVAGDRSPATLKENCTARSGRSRRSEAEGSLRTQ